MNTIKSVWKKVEKRGPDECWPWIGGWKSSNGYGRMDIDGVQGVYSNRAIYLAANPGSISLKVEKDQYVLHTCDNPCCCNPRHLFLGTHKDNMRDKVAKQRTPDFKGTKGPRSKLTQEQVDEIRRIRGYGISANELAPLFGVSKATIQSACSGRHYAP